MIDDPVNEVREPNAGEGETEPSASDPGTIEPDSAWVSVPDEPESNDLAIEIDEPCLSESGPNERREPANDRGEVDLTPILAAVAGLGAGLERRLDTLHALFEREVRAEATREKVVDRLHAELQEYKQDLLLGVLRPVFIDLVQLHDDIGKMLPAAGTGEAGGGEDRLDQVLRGVQQGIEDILYRQGVEPFQNDEPAFDPRRQRALATVATDDPALARTIAVRHRPGFRTQGGDRIIRPEMVSVYALKR